MQSAPFGIAALMEHAPAWSLVLSRVLGVFTMTPLLTSVMIPARFKAMLGVMLAAGAYPLLAHRLPEVPQTDILGLLPMVVSEGLIGLAIGAIVATPLLMLEMSGVIMGTGMGLGLARVYNPEADVDNDLLGQFLFFAGMGIFLALGGLEAAFRGVLASFDRIPPGAALGGADPLQTLVGVLASGFEMAIRVSAPVTAIVLLLVVLLGVVGKTMPQISVITVGFTLKIIAGLAMLAGGMYAVREPVSDAIREAIDAMSQWVQTLG